ncbi:MAG: SDR family NAD(P)-dependent oxidoreductase [Nakamurella sp.]
MEISHTGRTVLVTGAARGIGAAIATGFAAAGANVVIADLDEAGAARHAAVLADTHVVKTLGMGVDVTDEVQVAEAVERATAAFGSISVLVNNAGISRPGPTVDTTLDTWDKVLRANLTSAFLCAKYCLPAMRSAGWGRIVSVASFAAKSSPIYGDNASYAASKAGILGLTRNLAVEYGPAGITVNAIAPGIVDTELLRSAHSPERRTELLTKLPTGAFTTPDEIAALALFLASTQAASITGEVININSGLYFD